MLSYNRALAMAAATAVSMAMSTVGRADTIIDYNLNQAQCGGSGCGEPAGTSFGTVHVDIASNGLSATITFDLTTGLFHAGSNGLTSAVFDMTGATLWSGTSSPAFTWSADGPGVMEDGLGTFAEGVRCTTGNTSCGDNLVITVSGIALATALSSQNFFAGVDIWNVITDTAAQCSGIGTYNSSAGTCTITGAVGTSLAATPLPGAFALFGSVLFGGLGVSAWRKRRGRSVASIIA